MGSDLRVARDAGFVLEKPRRRVSVQISPQEAPDATVMLTQRICRRAAFPGCLIDSASFFQKLLIERGDLALHFGDFRDSRRKFAHSRSILLTITMIAHCAFFFGEGFGGSVGRAYAAHSDRR